MRYTPNHREETHKKIVETASREFRTHSFEGVGIAKLMAMLDLTHGGFYAHFEDKEALIAESTVFGLEESLNTMLEVLNKGGFKALFDTYLSEQHLAHPGHGCPIPLSSAEIARHSDIVRKSYTDKLVDIFRAVAMHIPGTTQKRKQEKARIMFASMAGAIVIAKAVADPELARTILNDTKKHLLTFIANE